MSRFQDDLVDYVLSRMVGSHDFDRQTSSQPAKRFILGCLAPRRNRDDLEDDDPLAIRDTEGSSIRARQFRVSVMIDPAELRREIGVRYEVSGSVFHKVKTISGGDLSTPQNAAGQNQKAGYEWRRIDFVIPGSVQLKSDLLTTPTRVNLDFSSLRSKANNDPENAEVITDSVWRAELTLSAASLENGNAILHFFVTNTDMEDPPGTSGRFQRTLFDCKLKAEIGDLNILEFCDEYKYNGFKQRYYYDFRTINCQAFWKGEREATGRVFSTRHYDVFRQSSIKPRDKLSDCDLSFAALSTDEGLVELEKLQKALRVRHQEYSSQLPVSFPEFQDREGQRECTWSERVHGVDRFSKLLDLYGRGLECLRDDESAILAFKRMNQTFKEYYERRYGSSQVNGSQPGWRLFQIVFIVSSLRSIIRQEDLDTVDVLHVATGGGKSEAYFGLTVLSMFFERANGKKAGVTAIVKFPLRMLSIQQLERLSSVLMIAEKVRKENEVEFPGASFSLGYYVGSSDDDFPDLFMKIKKTLYSDPSLTVPLAPAPASKILSKCPICAGEVKGDMRLVDDAKSQCIVHVCDKDSTHRFRIFLSDREVFRHRPTVIVSTVDKWAGLASQRRARSLLGANGSMCPDGHGFIPSGDVCEGKKEEAFTCDNTGRNDRSEDGPILSIQDEMHLLREAFGTISSHFEGLIEELVVANSDGRRIKHIAMSATLNGIDEQIRELYNKGAVVVPGPSPDGYGSESDFFFERGDGLQRKILGMKPNLRDNHYASLRTLLHLCEFLSSEQSEFMANEREYLETHGLSDREDALQAFRDHITPLTYHLKKQDAEDMHRLTDAVVNDSLERESLGRVNGTVLTGDRGLDELKETIDRIRAAVADYDVSRQVQPDSVYSPIFSTSVVSHGVDLEELNFMVFQGMPYSTSEYIQALSRIGRKRAGVVLLWFYPNRVRDDSFYRNFQRYHDSLDHEVRPTPLKRNSRLGVMQTVNSLFCAGILQFISEKAGRPLFHKSDVDAMSDERKRELAEFVRNSYGVAVKINIEQELDLRFRQVARSNNRGNAFFPNVLSDSGNRFYKNQRGMRGIQQELALIPRPQDVDLIRKVRGGR